MNAANEHTDADQTAEVAARIDTAVTPGNQWGTVYQASQLAIGEARRIVGISAHQDFSATDLPKPLADIASELWATREEVVSDRVKLSDAAAAKYAGTAKKFLTAVREWADARPAVK